MWRQATRVSLKITSSFAVAERPRDASCLSVVSERNLLLVTSASDLPLRTNKFRSLLFVMVVHAGCDKQRFTDAWRSVRQTARWTVAVVVRTPPVIDR